MDAANIPDHSGDPLEDLLAAVAAGRLSPREAHEAITRGQSRAMGDVTMDLQRLSRRGRGEAVFCEGKTLEQSIAAASALLEAGQNALLTRVPAEHLRQLQESFASITQRADAAARCLHLIQRHPVERGGLVAVLAAGTSDVPVAREAAFVARAYGSPVECAFDIGVAGIHRLVERADLLRRARVFIVAAGMEGALPSVVSGLVAQPVIGLPTSIGYGVGAGGRAALNSMLCSCSPGIAVVNIDNGFGAGYLADQINAIGDSLNSAP